jgi:adenylate cyclase class 2
VSREIEIKLAIPSVPILLRRLKALRARKITPRTHELNTLYDTGEQTLRHQGKLIRIRIESPPKKHAKPSRAVITFKGPTGASGPPNKRASRFKSREELEVIVPSSKPIAHLFDALGLRPAFRYEKYRTTYSLSALPGLKIEFDETPAGNFLELEGAPSAIDRAAKLLGYARSDYSTLSYADIHAEFVRRSGKKSSDMLF